MSYSSGESDPAPPTARQLRSSPTFDDELFLSQLTDAQRSKIEITEDGCWLVPKGSNIYSSYCGAYITYRQHLWRLSGRQKPSGYLMAVCGNERCANPAHCLPPERRKSNSTLGYRYAHLPPAMRLEAARVLRERGYEEAAPGRRLRFGQYRLWQRGTRIAWLEPMSLKGAKQCGKGDLYELLTGRKL